MSDFIQFVDEVFWRPEGIENRGKVLYAYIGTNDRGNSRMVLNIEMERENEFEQLTFTTSLKLPIPKDSNVGRALYELQQECEGELTPEDLIGLNIAFTTRFRYVGNREYCNLDTLQILWDKNENTEEEDCE